MSSKNPNAIPVTLDLDKPTQDFFTAIEEALNKVASGEKLPQVAAEELGPVLQLLTEVPSIAGDYTADPDSVERAAALGLLKLKNAVLKIRAAKLAPAAPVK